MELIFWVELMKPIPHLYSNYWPIELWYFYKKYSPRKCFIWQRTPCASGIVNFFDSYHEKIQQYGRLSVESLLKMFNLNTYFLIFVHFWILLVHSSYLIISCVFLVCLKHLFWDYRSDKWNQYQLYLASVIYTPSSAVHFNRSDSFCH